MKLKCYHKKIKVLTGVGEALSYVIERFHRGRHVA
jgi:hypothetical protein